MRDLNNNDIFVENSNRRRERIVTRLVADEIAKELERTLKTCSLLVQTSFVKKAESRSLAGEKSYWSDRLDWTDIARRVSVALGDRVDPAGLQSFFHRFTRGEPGISPSSPLIHAADLSTSFWWSEICSKATRDIFHDTWLRCPPWD